MEFSYVLFHPHKKSSHVSQFIPAGPAYCPILSGLAFVLDFSYFNKVLF